MAESEDELPRGSVEFSDLELAQLGLDRHEAREVLHLVGKIAKTVDELFLERHQLAVGLELGEALVEEKPELDVRDVIVGNLRGDRKADVGLDEEAGRFSPKFANGLFEELRVEIESYFGDLSGLVGSQEVARAADLEIV